MKHLKRAALLASTMILGTAGLSSAQAGVMTFFNDSAGFEAASVGEDLDNINFDDITSGTNIAGLVLKGVTLTSPDGNTLDVVDADDTFTPGDTAGINSLLATSGSMILSPGGIELVPGSALAERDSLEITFAEAVSAFAIDILFQSYDLAPFVSIRAFNAEGTRIYFENVPGSGLGGGAPADNVFFGIVSDDMSTNIARIVITESDGNASFPDSNIGFDSIQFSSLSGDAVPVPAALWLFIAPLAGALGLRRAKRKIA
ncbi:hypothetical protein [Parvularcula sp. LCG005]|uniref:hypothetical protein n=1 Tax=Parvularcula sp. LCG005 TaxID=3078805 RepID=UPI0029434859|nr:hypothetical protein [Parvularcula sp. LCG005]WOI54396.1 hypothetical protein RUI03_05180 [Parvularcula sp. LCG005]